jgi:hypothetical protein
MDQAARLDAADAGLLGADAVPQKGAASTIEQDRPIYLQRQIEAGLGIERCTELIPANSGQRTAIGKSAA